MGGEDSARGVLRIAQGVCWWSGSSSVKSPAKVWKGSSRARLSSGVCGIVAAVGAHAFILHSLCYKATPAATAATLTHSQSLLQGNTCGNCCDTH
eukprot:scaffold17613_cov21-Tisochrysis_lutea.AAC.2